MLLRGATRGIFEVALYIPGIKISSTRGRQRGGQCFHIRIPYIGGGNVVAGRETWHIRGRYYTYGNGKHSMSPTERGARRGCMKCKGSMDLGTNYCYAGVFLALLRSLTRHVWVLGEMLLRLIACSPDAF